MLTGDQYLDLIRDTHGIRRDLRDPSNRAQLSAVFFPSNDALMLAAGPGSGKTTVIVLRALRSVFVDGILPESIVLTSFSRKAARELRTRWLDWGAALLNEASDLFDVSLIDLNRCVIDTLDSICQQVLSEFRDPGTISPTVAEESASKLMLKRASFGDIYRDPANKVELDAHFQRYTFANEPIRNQGQALQIAKDLCERLIQDRVDIVNYADAGVPQEIICRILEQYTDRMNSINIFDYTALQNRMLERLVGGFLDDWLADLKVLMIDEYQDTNPLQEAIYFEIIRRALPVTTVVGDDDQAMYRFRGGSVELFTLFANRFNRATGLAAERLDLIRNFRSTPEIVAYYNSHIASDPSFVDARISPPKPEVVASRPQSGLPVLGMFRDTTATLATDLASFLDNLFSTGQFSHNGIDINVPAGGAMGDAVLLSHSVEEQRFNRPRPGTPGQLETRFPGLLRAELLVREHHVFNPRGLSLRLIPDVQVLLGLILLCIDPDGSRVKACWPTNQANHFLALWRTSAVNYVNSAPFPKDRGGLGGFVERWQIAATGAVNSNEFPRDWPLLELIFHLLCWLPSFQSETEHQVWLEAVTRIISGVAVESPYGMKLLQTTERDNNGEHVIRSRESVIRDVLIPIAEREVDVDEDIMPSIPRNRLQVMTIHQSKGLEFPLVIVDVGSHFSSNHRGHRFRRHPVEPSNVVNMEDDVEPFLSTPLRGGRTPIDRTFDDLVRLYYVAFSRPQSVLLLIGLESCLNYGAGPDLRQRAIPNVAMGWNRDETWPWRQPFLGRRPPVLANTLFSRI